MISTFHSRSKGSTLLFYLLLLSFACKGQDIYFRHYTVDDGLSQNSVVDIDQDQDGFIWLATQDGLNRLDGHSVHIYPKQFIDVTEPRFSHLGKIFVDHQNRIWKYRKSGYQADSIRLQSNAQIPLGQCSRKLPGEHHPFV